MKPSQDEDKDNIPETRVVKYFKARRLGKNKSQALQIAGYKSNRHAARLEQTKAYQSITNLFKELMLEETPLHELAQISARNARQTRDVGGSNAAVKMILDKLDDSDKPDTSEVVVILRG